MDSDIVDVVTEWDSTPVSGGYAGLHDLADREFTGAVCEGSVWAFVLNGKVVGVFDGGIEAFEDADATAYHAPDPALPLLYAMQAGDSETRAKYYSNDTPLSSADATLSSGSFTGYIELSENVLSGDYYVVYYGGKSMSVAFVGNKRTLLAGDEAFERADDEVGIYQVNEASVDIVDIPEPEPEPEPESADEPPAQAAAVAEQDVTEQTDDDEPTAGAEGADGTASDDADETTDTTPADTTVASADANAGDSTLDDPASKGETPEAGESTATPRVGADDPEPVSTSDAGGPVDSAESVPAESTPEPVPDAGGDEESSSPTDAAADAAVSGTSAAAAAAADEDVFSEEAEWREATSIPALDPEKSTSDGPGEAARESAAGSSTAVSQRTRKRRRQASESPQKRQHDRPQGSQPSQRAQTQQSAESSGPQRADVARLEEQLQATAREKEELEAARERIAAERDDYRSKAEKLQSRVSELETEVERLESELADVRAGSSTAGATETMSPEAALDGTNLFVRYGSKSGGTLEKAHAGDVEREEVNENLRLEHHTGFETDGVVVDDDPYEAFLHDSIEYGFVQWVVEDLLYEIRETGNRGSLDELFDVIPKIDRAELHGDVTLKYTENGEEHREQQSFDVVLRDRMGNPLVVANLNGSRDPATEEMMTSLVENTSRLRESNDSLGAAFLVTASYFDPGALETAADATGGGLLSRGRRKSFVKLSRKQGFHLCLVETRNGDFHLNVPEL
jgi:hypothetical protein